MPHTGLVLTHYQIEGSGLRFRAREEAEANWRMGKDGQIVEHAHEYRVGDKVEVHAYGAWRPGTVASLRRIRVVVHYERNRRGDMAAKAFHGAEVRPRGEDQWVRN